MKKIMPSILVSTMTIGCLATSGQILVSAASPYEGESWYDELEIVEENREYARSSFIPYGISNLFKIRHNVLVIQMIIRLIGTVKDGTKSMCQVISRQLKMRMVVLNMNHRSIVTHDILGKILKVLS